MPIGVALSASLPPARGISSGAALLLLLASLIGSYFNIPVAYLPEQRVLAQQEIYFFGMRYVVPFVAQWPGTLIALNVGGAVIPIRPGLRFRGFSRPAVFGALGQVLIIGSDIEHLLFEDRIGHALRHRARFLRTVAPVLWII